jgi:2,2-dialkylglycine decarboxylase (pyruvate)
VAEIRGRGLLLGIELVRERHTLEPFPGRGRFTQRVVAAGLSHGVFFYPGGVDAANDVILLGPPFTITDAEVELVASVLRQSIDDAVARTEKA